MMNEPLLIVIDGCPGLIKAVEEVSTSEIQRCTKYRTENVLNKCLMWLSTSPFGDCPESVRSFRKIEEH